MMARNANVPAAERLRKLPLPTPLRTRLSLAVRLEPPRWRFCWHQGSSVKPQPSTLARPVAGLTLTMTRAPRCEAKLSPT
jgi:hypothetical protein